MSVLRVAFAGAVVAGLVGCGSVPPPKGPVPSNLDRDRYGALEYFAARNLNCEQGKLQYSAFGGSKRHLFKGCDDQMEMLLLEGSDANALGAAKGFVLPSPANAYAKERKCAVTATTVERVDHRTRIVDGCGNRATYLMACGYAGCTWVANSESKR